MCIYIYIYIVYMIMYTCKYRHTISIIYIISSIDIIGRGGAQAPPAEEARAPPGEARTTFNYVNLNYRLLLTLTINFNYLLSTLIITAIK